MIRRVPSPDGLDRLRRRDLVTFLRGEQRRHSATRAELRDRTGQLDAAEKRLHAAIQQLRGAAESHRLDAAHLTKHSAEQRIHRAIEHTLLDIARDLERSTG